MLIVLPGGVIGHLSFETAEIRAPCSCSSQPAEVPEAPSFAAGTAVPLRWVGRAECDPVRGTHWIAACDQRPGNSRTQRLLPVHDSE